MALVHYTMKVPKGNDRQIIGNARELERIGGRVILSVVLAPAYTNDSGFQPPAATMEDHPDVSRILQENAALFREFNFQFEGNINIGYTRDSTNIFDSLIIRPGDQGVPAADYAIFVGKVSETFSEVLTRKGFMEHLGAESAQFYAAREDALSRLERIHADFIGGAERLVEQLPLKVAESRAAIEREYATRQSESEEELRKRREALASREADLEARKKEVDDRNTRHVRRKIYEDFKTKLKERSQTFELTKGTRNLRWFPLAAAGLFLAFILGNFYFYPAPSPTAPAVSPYLSLARQAVLLVTFGGTATYVIRLLQRWAQRHADEEFRLKRLDLDIDRASWLVEMALEWREEKGEEIPKELVERLSRNLFAADDVSDGDLHPFETVMSSLFANAANLNIKGPGVEVGFDRKTLKAAAREAGD